MIFHVFCQFSEFTSGQDALPTVINSGFVHTLPKEQASTAQQILFSWGHDPFTLACKARPSFDGCGTFLSVSLSLSLSLCEHLYLCLVVWMCMCLCEHVFVSMCVRVFVSLSCMILCLYVVANTWVHVLYKRFLLMDVEACTRTRTRKRVRMRMCLRVAHVYVHVCVCALVIVCRCENVCVGLSSSLSGVKQICVYEATQRVPTRSHRDHAFLSASVATRWSS